MGQPTSSPISRSSKMRIINSFLPPFFVTFACIFVFQNCHAISEFGPNHTLIVLAAPSIWDVNYANDFVPIVEFQIRLVRLLNEYESAVLIADRHTMPYLDGRIKLLAEHLPSEKLIESSIYDINLHDFAPLGTRHPVKFLYRNDDWAPVASKQLDDSINRFLVGNGIRIHKREPDIVLSGRDVVDNGVDRALISNKVLANNAGRMPEAALLLKLKSAFGKVTLVPAPTPFMGRRNLRLDDVMAFIDHGVLAMSCQHKAIADKVHMELFKREKKGITVMELPVEDEERARQLMDDPYLSDEGNCGVYSAILATARFLFVPVFGNLPANWKLGYSTMRDKLMLHLIAVNTRKTVVPIQIPRELCRRGLSLRSLCWTLKGGMASRVAHLTVKEREEKEREQLIRI